MQTERKEKEGNALATGLGRAYDGLKQGPSRGLVVTLLVIVSVVLVVLLFRYFWMSSSAVDSARWMKLDDAIFPGQLDFVIHDQELKGTTQERIANFKEARMKLARGIKDFASEIETIREEARKNVSEATSAYEGLIKESNRFPLLQQEAMWGAAKGYETQGGGDNIDRAKTLYQDLQKQYPNTALGKNAKRQLERLNSSSTQEDLRELNKLLNPPSR